jgi:hypothetical protein
MGAHFRDLEQIARHSPKAAWGLRKRVLNSGNRGMLTVSVDPANMFLTIAVGQN